MSSVQYFVECGCSRKVPVQLFQAGTNISCPGCRKTLAVPGTSRLQQQAGDNYPLLSPIDKIYRTLENREAPFDGICHACGAHPAEIAIQLQLKHLQERDLDNDGGVTVTPLGIRLVVAGGVEHWRILKFPLLLCQHCHKEYEHSRKRFLYWKVAEWGCWVVILLGIIYLFYEFPEFFAAMAGLLAITAFLARNFASRRQIHAPAFLLNFAKRIRWVPEILNGEEEYSLTVLSVGACEKDAGECCVNS